MPCDKFICNSSVLTVQTMSDILPHSSGVMRVVDIRSHGMSSAENDPLRSLNVNYEWLEMLKSGRSDIDENLIATDSSVPTPDIGGYVQSV